MSPKRSVPSQQSPPHPPNLTISRSEAEKQIDSRITLGREILSYPMNSEEEYEAAHQKHRLWHEYNIELLRRIFDTEELSQQYSFWGIIGSVYGLNAKIKDLLDDVKTHLSRLESIRERLPLFPEPTRLETVRNPFPEDSSSPTVRTVFLVHGTDPGVKEMVARYLTKLSLDPIILHEQPNLGATLIEKLERNSIVAFSIILLTCDDKAYSVSDPSLIKSRARQNVVFELGYFIGKLGRGKVCALYSEGVELPSDFHGVVYIPLDTAGAWRILLARELKASGLDIDLNNAL